MAKQIDKQNIAENLSEQFQIPLKDALRFVENFSEVLLDYLKDKENIQIDDLGIFSLTNDPEGGKFKVHFSSDEGLQQRINKPFEQFEKVLLDDDVAFDSLETVVEGVSNEVDHRKKLRSENLKNNEPVVTESVKNDKDSSENQQTVDDVSDFRSTQVSRAILDMSLNGFRKGGNSTKAAESSSVKDEKDQNETAEQKPETVALGEQQPPVKDENHANNTNKENPNNIRNIYENKELAMNREELNKKFGERNPPNNGPSSGPRRPQSGNSKKFWIIVIICVIVICCVAAYFVTTSNSLPSSGDSDMAVDSTAILDDSNEMDSIDANASQAPVSQQQDVKENVRPTVKKRVSQHAAWGSSKPLAYVTMDDGLSLRQLALRYYGNKTFWVYIYQENKCKIANPNNIHVGTRLVIPGRAKYGIDRNNSHSIAKARSIEKKLYAQFCR